MRIAVGAVLVAVCVSGCGSCDERGITTADGRSRSYRLVVPDGVGEGAPLVIALHGGGGNAAQLQASLTLDALAADEGFVVAYPNGTGKSVLGKSFFTWNSDEECCGSAVEEGVDDVAFLDAVIDDVADAAGVDVDRVFVFGHSNGGAMAHRYACERAERVAASASVGAPQRISACAPGRAVPFLVVHGTDDRCAPYDDAASCGGCFGAALAELGVVDEGDVNEDVLADCDGAVAQASRWQRDNGCAQSFVDGADRRVVVAAGDAVCEVLADDAGCAAEVRLCTMQGAGHAFPSSAPCSGGARVCEAVERQTGPRTDDLSVDDLWAFFATAR